MKTSAKSLILSTSYFNRKFLTKSILCTLALSSGLLISGQTFAAPRFSTGAGGNWTAPTTWNSTSCATATNNVIPLAAEAVTICAGDTVTVDAVSVGGSATVEAGATLNLSTNILNLDSGTGTLTNNGGTITSGVAAHVLDNLVNTAGSMVLTGDTTTTLAGNVTIFGGTLTLQVGLTAIGGNLTYSGGTLGMQTALVTIAGLFTANSAFTMPGTVTSIAGGVTVGGGILTLGAPNLVAGNVTMGGGGSIAGVLKLSDAVHAINGTGSIATLNLSPITTAGRTITFTPTLNTAITVSAFTMPTGAGTVTLVCSGGTAGGTISTPSAITSGTATGTYTCTKGGIVNASIDFRDSGKISTFSEDIEIK